jgi:predicted Zn finger-like uncharacterized protein
MVDSVMTQCPHCGAKYNVVRVAAPPSQDGEVTCLNCGGPLSAREGQFVLKYFLVDRRRRRPVYAAGSAGG